MVNIDLEAPKVKLGTATGQTQQSTVTGDLDLPHLPSGFPIKGHLRTGFHHTLIRVGPIFVDDCKVTLMREVVIVRDQQGTALLTGSHEASGSRL